MRRCWRGRKCGECVKTLRSTTLSRAGAQFGLEVLFAEPICGAGIDEAQCSFPRAWVCALHLWGYHYKRINGVRVIRRWRLFCCGTASTSPPFQAEEEQYDEDGYNKEQEHRNCDNFSDGLQKTFRISTDEVEEATEELMRMTLAKLVAKTLSELDTLVADRIVLWSDYYKVITRKQNAYGEEPDGKVSLCLDPKFPSSFFTTPVAAIAKETSAFAPAEIRTFSDIPYWSWPTLTPAGVNRSSIGLNAPVLSAKEYQTDALRENQMTATDIPKPTPNCIQSSVRMVAVNQSRSMIGARTKIWAEVATAAAKRLPERSRDRREQDEKRERQQRDTDQRDRRPGSVISQGWLEVG
ncbi:hypothetical protein B0H14DRAFT_2623965 [Mycena olivaceomarginata]|nr:hypothetical protein B0H14DRAFT_2623965 [Mycena olivaceomarginata]